MPRVLRALEFSSFSSVVRRISCLCLLEIVSMRLARNCSSSSLSESGLNNLATSSSLRSSARVLAVSSILSASFSYSSSMSKRSGVRFSATYIGFSTSAGSAYTRFNVVFVASRNSSPEW